MNFAKKVWRSPYALLIFIQLFSFGIFLPYLGFYHDDWGLLEPFHQSGRFWGVIRFCATCGSYAYRPVEIIQYPIFFAIGWFHPWVHQMMLLTLQTVETLLLFALLERLLESRGLALAAAAIAVIYPNREIYHIWFSNSPQTVAQMLAAASLLAHLRWIGKRTNTRLIAGQILYLLSILTYESCAFMPLLLAGGLLARRMAEGSTPKDAAARTVREFMPCAATLIIALSWQWFGVRIFTHSTNQKADLIAFSFRHLFKAYGAGFECITNRVIHACAMGLREAILRLPPWLWIFWVACTVAAVAWMDSLRDDPSPRSLKTALGAIIGGFLGSYAPYALSGSYMPTMYGVLSRTNGTGAWIGGLLLAAGAAALRGRSRRAQAILLSIVVGAFTWTNWAFTQQWAHSWVMQRDILRKVSAHVIGRPGPAVILLSGAPSRFGQAVVFNAHYDFDAALRLTTGRSDLSGNIASHMHFEPRGAVEYENGKPIKIYSYENLYLYRYDYDRLERVKFHLK